MTLAKSSIYEIYYKVERQHWWFLARKEILLNLIRQYFPKLSHIKVLDIGASTGSYLEVFQKLGAYVEAHDASAEAVTYLRQISDTGNVHQKKFPVDYETYPPAQFDLLLLFDVLEHIADDRRAFETALKLVRPGGLVVITVPACKALWGPYDVCNRHYRRYNLQEVETLIDHNVVNVKKLTYFSTLLFPLMFVIRFLENVLYKLTGKMFSFYFMPGLANRLLLAIFRLEIHLLPKWNLPFGSSILAIMEKKA